jgi:hypothetical protein
MNSISGLMMGLGKRSSVSQEELADLVSRSAHLFLLKHIIKDEG